MPLFLKRQCDRTLLGGRQEEGVKGGHHACPPPARPMSWRPGCRYRIRRDVPWVGDPAGEYTPSFGFIGAYEAEVN